MKLQKFSTVYREASGGQEFSMVCGEASGVQYGLQ